MEETNEILRFISETHRNEFHDRRQYEWKAVMATLTFFVLALAARLSGQVRLPEDCAFRTVVWVVFFGLAFVLSRFLHRLHQGNKTNKRLAEVAENALIEASSNMDLNKELQSAQSVTGHPGCAGWAFWWEAVVIFVFATAAAFLVTYVPR